MAMEVKTMDVKNTQQLAKPVQQQVSTKAAKTEQVFEFLSSVKVEFAKITWTTQDELRTYTKIVIAGTFMLGMGIYIVDVLIQLALASFGSIMRLFGG